MAKPEERIAELEATVQKQRRAYKTAENMLQERIHVLEKALRELKWWRANLDRNSLLTDRDDEDLHKILDGVML